MTGLAGNVGAGGGIPPGILGPGPGPAPHEPYAETGLGLGICIPPGPGERFAELDEEKRDGGVPFFRGGRPEGGPPLPFPLDPAAAPGRALGLGSADDERPCFACVAGFCNFPDELEFGGERFAGRADDEDGLDEDEGVAFGLGFGLRPKKEDFGGDGGRIEGDGVGDGIGVVFLGISSGRGILLRWRVRFVSGLYVGLNHHHKSVSH